ncbi:uncharacterized protein LOC116140845 isoform X1 [Pistacia vera]|uniref:uncharacterized protein LOC116140845 isoform X1 n=1 Tax=Pistacia vera TaxID=55513 RepID=UPI0012631917|nr:uncharacterized protein LOC116140845 isoform X1 [Pistacia vera]XP_031282279.1 uncharacterized protein LOC116140845 isoform X1 [Pistacia vera]
MMVLCVKLLLQLENEAKMRRSEDIIQRSASDIPLKKRRLLQYKESKYLDAPTAQHVQTRGAKTESLNVEVTRRPDSYRRSWFKELPWEKSVQRADEVGSLECLENLDRSYISSKVECCLVDRPPLPGALQSPFDKVSLSVKVKKRNITSKSLLESRIRTTNLD